MIIYIANAYLIFTFIFMIYYVYFKWRHRSLNKIPIPPPLPIVGHVLYFHTNNQLKLFLKFYSEVGEVVKFDLGPCWNSLLVGDLKITEFLLTDPNVTKGEEYKYFTWLKGGILSADGDDFKQRKKLVVQLMSPQGIEQYLHVSEKYTKLFVEQLSGMEGQIVDVYPLINVLTWKTICDIIMGHPVDTQEDLIYEYNKAVKSELKIAAKRTTSVWKRFDLLFPLSKDYEVLKKGKELLTGVVRDILAKRDPNFEEPNRRTLMNCYLQSKINGRLLNTDESIIEINNTIFGGSHTVVVVLSFALYELANNPDVQNKIIEELEGILGSDRSRPFTKDDMNQMEYLERVIKEALRMYPPTPVLPKMIKHDCVYDGIFYPKNLSCYVFVYGIHRNPKYWKNPNKFDPDRFLPENVAKRPPNTWIPFSIGNRWCLGQKIAFVEMKTVIARILLNYELLSAGKEHAVDMNMNTSLFSNNGARIMFKRREWNT